MHVNFMKQQFNSSQFEIVHDPRAKTLTLLNKMSSSCTFTYLYMHYLLSILMYRTYKQKQCTIRSRFLELKLNTRKNCEILISKLRAKNRDLPLLINYKKISLILIKLGKKS